MINYPETNGTGTDCKTTLSYGVNARNDGPMLTFISIQNQSRHYCSSQPNGTASGLPLVLFFPGSGSQANTIYNGYVAGYPGLRQLADSFVIKSGVTGYLLISVHPLNHHWPTPSVGPLATGEDGAKNDYIFRSLNSPDFSFVDSLIDFLVASGQVDPNYIFLSGWSNGCYMSQYYGILRNNAPTMGGNRVRAVASYSGENPFGAVAGDINCAYTSYPSSDLPIYVIGRDCDLVNCSFQQLWFNSTLPTILGNTVSKWILINSSADVVYSCMINNCTSSLAISNHITWPTQYTVSMLTWLQNSPPLSPTSDTATSNTGTSTSPTTSGKSSSINTSTNSSTKTVSNSMIVFILFLLFAKCDHSFKCC